MLKYFLFLKHRGNIQFSVMNSLGCLVNNKVIDMQVLSIETGIPIQTLYDLAVFQKRITYKQFRLIRKSTDMNVFIHVKI